MITPAQLRTVCPTVNEPRSVILCALINQLCPHYGMDTADKFHEFLATVAHESAEFRLKEENMNYSESRLVQVWPSRFPDKFSAQPYAYNPESLANKVYANRMGNGNEKSGDGWRFRGAGWIMLTGRDMHTKFARYKKTDLTSIGDYLRTDLGATDSALWFFCVEKQLMDDAERDEMVRISIAVNGGKIGLADRLKYYERAKKAIPESAILSWLPGSGL